ncbi:MAG: sensor histidine kinase [Burkholderiales bacterium]
MASTLQRRLTGNILALLVVVCALFCVGIYAAFEAAEDLLFDVHREREIADRVAFFERDPQLLKVPQQNFTVYAIEHDDKSTLPPYLHGLTAADDELVLNGHEYHVQLESRGTRTYYFLLDEHDFDVFERHLFSSMALLVAVVMVVAGLLGAVVARRVSQPLTDLAQRVQQLDDQTVIGPSSLPGANADAEVSLLAQAIGVYHQRVSQLLHREREFSADVSHELRTPLSGIQGAAELLERHVANQPALATLTARVRRGCAQMTSLIEALLYLAREPGSFSKQMESVSLFQAVTEQVAALSDVTHSRGIVVDIVQDSHAATVQAIPAVIDIVLGNILRNAIKYTDRKLITLHVGARQVVVQDYGPGIDPAMQARLFERFARGGEPDTTGNGIGLALVRRFCNQYGWTLDLQSTASEGTRIAVMF